DSEQRANQGRTRVTASVTRWCHHRVDEALDSSACSRPSSFAALGWPTRGRGPQARSGPARRASPPPRDRGALSVPRDPGHTSGPPLFPTPPLPLRAATELAGSLPAPQLPRRPLLRAEEPPASARRGDGHGGPGKRDEGDLGARGARG